jgi:hypothetical protein
MQIPRDLSSRMIEAAERTPVVDVYERLMPESQRVGQRVDFIAWLVACMGLDLQAVGLAPDGLGLLRNVEGDPAARWSLLARHWPYLRTTGMGRLVLRVAWELYGVENIDERTWKNISARLWEQAAPGFYERLLHGRANIRLVLVDNAVDVSTRSHCAPIKSYDGLLSIDCHPKMVSWLQSLDPSAVLTLENLDASIERSVQQCVEQGCAGFKVGMLPDVSVPSSEQVGWAFGRMFRYTTATAQVEPDLQSYLGHRLVAAIAGSPLPLQVHVSCDDEIAGLGAWARQYPQVRFVGVYNGGGDSYSLSTLGRMLPNVSLALTNVWHLGQVLRQWIHRVPLGKILAVGGGLPMVEAACAQALIVRERIAALFAEMITAGELDEEDALVAIDCLLHSNAEAHYVRRR